MKKMPKSVVERYILHKDFDLEGIATEQEKQEFVQEAMETIQKQEWIYAIPVVNLGKFFYDVHNENNILANEMYSVLRNAFKIGYTIASTALALGPTIDLATKVVNNLIN